MEYWHYNCNFQGIWKYTLLPQQMENVRSRYFSSLLDFCVTESYSDGLYRYSFFSFSSSCSYGYECDGVMEHETSEQLRRARLLW